MQYYAISPLWEHHRVFTQTWMVDHSTKIDYMICPIASRLQNYIAHTLLNSTDKCNISEVWFLSKKSQHRKCTEKMCHKR